MAPFTGLAIFRPEDVKPLIRTRVPGDLVCLQSSARKFHEELAQRIIANDSRDPISFIGLRKADAGHSIIGAVGACGGKRPAGWK